MPGDAALSQCIAGVEGKVEFGGQIRRAPELQAGAVIGQIAYDTAGRRAPVQHDLGALENFGSRKAATLNHGPPAINRFSKITFVRICLTTGNGFARKVIIGGNLKILAILWDRLSLRHSTGKRLIVWRLPALGLAASRPVEREHTRTPWPHLEVFASQGLSPCRHGRLAPDRTELLTDRRVGGGSSAAKDTPLPNGVSAADSNMIRNAAERSSHGIRRPRRVRAVSIVEN